MSRTAISIVAIVALSGVTLVGFVLTMIFVGCSVDRSWGPAPPFVLVSGLLLSGGGLTGVVLLSRRLLRSVDEPFEPVQMAAPGEVDAGHLWIAIVVRVAVAFAPLALVFWRSFPSRTPRAYASQIAVHVLSICAYAAPYVAALAFLSRNRLHRRAVIAAAMYALAKLLRGIVLASVLVSSSSAPFAWFIFAGAATDLWIAIAALALFARWPDRRDALAEFILAGLASAAYAVYLQFRLSTFLG